MDISLAEEHAYYFVPQISLDDARERVEKKKTTLVAGTFGNLLSASQPGRDPGGIDRKPLRAILDGQRLQSYRL